MLNDNWDIEFPQASTQSFHHSSSRSGGPDIIARDPDQQLAEALARLEQEDDDNDDDQETESTFISHHSNKYGIFDMTTTFPPGLDDYILNCGGSGLVTKLGTHKRVEDMGDWADDLKLPPSIRCHPPPLANLVCRADVLDDFLVSSPAPAPAPRKTVHFSSDGPQRNSYTPEGEVVQRQQQQQRNREEHGEMEEEGDGEEGNSRFDDLEFPDNMADLAIKPRSPSPSPRPSAPASSTPAKFSARIPATLRQRLTTAIEDDEEEFGKDLVVESPHAFMAHTMPPKKPALTSRIPRRAAGPPQHPALSLNPRFQETTHTSQKPQAIMGTGTAQGMRSATTSLSPKKPPVVAAHKTPNLQRTYGNGSELDGLDLLPEWRRRSLSFWKRENRVTDGVDPQRPWRHNMARRKPDLIQPHERPLKKEYANMRYDAVRCQWQGNEESTLSFGTNTSDKQHLPHRRRRPALLSNRMKSSAPAKYTEMVVGSMVFDPIEMRWVKAVDDDEDNVLDLIEDLPSARPTANASTRLPTAATASASAAAASSVFDLPPDVQIQMREQEETSFQRMWSWSLPNHTRRRQNKVSIANMLYNA